MIFNNFFIVHAIQILIVLELKILVVAMITILIWRLNHFNLAIDFKYQHIQIILSCKKLILHLSCFCSASTVESWEWAHMPRIL